MVSFLGFPSISMQSLKFLETLTSFYRDHPLDVNSEESSDEVNHICTEWNFTYIHTLLTQELSAYELKRLKNIERNRAELKRINESTKKVFILLIYLYTDNSDIF